MENYNGELKDRNYPECAGKFYSGINKKKSHNERNSKNYGNQPPYCKISYLQNKEDDFKIKPC